MQETLTIRNFGPIKDVTLDLRKINVFIGDQGTGKSTVAKVLNSIRSFCKYYRKDNFDKISDLEHIFKEIGILQYFNEKSYIKYKFKDFYIEIALNKIINTKKPFDELFGTDLFPYEYDETFIIAERQMIPIFSDSLYDFNSKSIKLPKLYNDLGTLYNTARKEKNSFDLSEIIGVNFQSVNGTDVIFSNKMSGNLLLSLASTGMQGSIPLLIIMDFLNSQSSLSNKRSHYSDTSIIENIPYLIIEEPELNLFPETQKKLLNSIISTNYFKKNEFEILIDKINGTRKNRSPLNILEIEFKDLLYKHKLLITTHSPYILTSLNNLMYAYQVGQKHRKEVSGIIPEKYWVNPEDVRCYLMEDGEAKLIMDEVGLIDASHIDGVSNDLNNEFLRINEVKLSDELGVN